MSDYAARERAAIVAFAWSVLADKKSSPEDKATARARITSADGKYDWSKVPLDERRIALAALRKARVP